jgi:2-desacetyl-2-hydroxyethyl bacteriochlorophyllide A dehydrogenase
VKACGICGSEIPFYNGIPDYMCKHPWTIGHEMAGVVAQLKGNDTELSVGDRVAIEPLISCGKCYACRVGKYNCCANLKVIGASTPGGFAEYVVAPVHRCHKIPGNMSFPVAALAEPYSIGANILKRGQITKNDLIVVNGAGPIGLTVIDLAKNIHGAKVLVTDIYDGRLARAKEFGADVVVNPTTENVIEKVMEFTSNEGASLVVDATGVQVAIESTQHLVAAGGRIVVVGYTEDDIKINGILIIKKEITLLGSRNSANLYPYVIQCLTSGKLKIDKFISTRFAFEEVAQAFNYANTNFKSIGKVMVEF